MIAYRLAEFGVERAEANLSTFIQEDPSNAAWVEFQAWRALGNQPAPAAERPKFYESPPPNNLWIIGAGSYGREVFCMAQGARGCGVDWRVAGFLNDIATALDKFPEFPRIHANTGYQPLPGDVFVCAVGDRAARKRLCAEFKSRGAQFINLIHNSALVSGTAVLGEGITVEAFTGIGANSRIGDFSTILGHVNIAHDVRIGAIVVDCLLPFGDDFLCRCRLGNTR